MLDGVVEAAGEPFAGLGVALHAGSPSGSRVLGTATTDGEGRFSLTYEVPGAGTPVYAVARAAGGAAALLCVLGTERLPGSVVVNELTTVAGVWTLAQFLDGEELRGNAVGMRNAAGNAANLVDPRTGEIAPPAINIQTTTLATINSLGNLIGACAVGDGCAAFFALATPRGGSVPKDTLAAALNVARNPWHNVEPLFELVAAQAEPHATPILRYAPTTWTLSLVYTGGGLDAPGGISIDAQGFVWTNNNFLVGSQSFLRQRGFPGLGVTRLAPNGDVLSPPFNFQGAGIFGAGYGIVLDQRGHVRVGNFAGNSVSELDAQGRPVTDAAYTAGGTTQQVQGTAVDQQGNVWVANFGGDSVSFFPAGAPEAGRTFSVTEFPKCSFDHPFGLAIDHQGRAWVANQFASTIVRVDRSAPEKCPDGPIPVGEGPMGIALDSAGNVWTANDAGKSVTLHEPASERTRTFANDAQMVGPWGIAVDGADNVWVADFFGRRLSHICGVAGNCPPGVALGEPFSPPAGYGANGGLQHITFVAIDQAGNVWAANNNNDQRLCDVPPPEHVPVTVTIEKNSMACGGNGVVVMFGAAAPVAAPLIGPPSQP